jgi:hypothetical protein
MVGFVPLRCVRRHSLQKCPEAQRKYCISVPVTGFVALFSHSANRLGANTGGWTIGPLLVAIWDSLTPSIWSNNNNNMYNKLTHDLLCRISEAWEGRNIKGLYVSFEVLTAVKLSMLFWVVVLCELVGRYQRFGGTYIVHLQDLPLNQHRIRLNSLFQC